MLRLAVIDGHGYDVLPNGVWVDIGCVAGEPEILIAARILYITTDGGLIIEFIVLVVSGQSEV